MKKAETVKAAKSAKKQEMPPRLSAYEFVDAFLSVFGPGLHWKNPLTGEVCTLAEFSDRLKPAVFSEYELGKISIFSAFPETQKMLNTNSPAELLDLVKLRKFSKFQIGQLSSLAALAERALPHLMRDLR